jgi:hypothetical protein
VHGVPEESVWDAARRGNTIVHAFRGAVPDVPAMATRPADARLRLRNLRAIAAHRQEVTATAPPLRDADGVRGVRIA